MSDPVSLKFSRMERKETNKLYNRPASVPVKRTSNNTADVRDIINAVGQHIDNLNHLDSSSQLDSKVFEQFKPLLVMLRQQEPATFSKLIHPDGSPNLLIEKGVFGNSINTDTLNANISKIKNELKILSAQILEVVTENPDIQSKLKTQADALKLLSSIQPNTVRGAISTETFKDIDAADKENTIKRNDHLDGAQISFSYGKQNYSLSAGLNTTHIILPERGYAGKEGAERANAETVIHSLFQGSNLAPATHKNSPLSNLFYKFVLATTKDTNKAKIHGLLDANDYSLNSLWAAVKNSTAFNGSHLDISSEKDRNKLSKYFIEFLKVNHKSAYQDLISTGEISENSYNAITIDPSNPSSQLALYKARLTKTTDETEKKNIAVHKARYISNQTQILLEKEVSSIFGKDEDELSDAQKHLKEDLDGFLPDFFEGRPSPAKLTRDDKAKLQHFLKDCVKIDTQEGKEQLSFSGTTLNYQKRTKTKKLATETKDALFPSLSEDVHLFKLSGSRFDDGKQAGTYLISSGDELYTYEHTDKTNRDTSRLTQIIQGKDQDNKDALFITVGGKLHIIHDMTEDNIKEGLFDQDFLDKLHKQATGEISPYYPANFSVKVTGQKIDDTHLPPANSNILLLQHLAIEHFSNFTEANPNACFLGRKEYEAHQYKNDGNKDYQIIIADGIKPKSGETKDQIQAEIDHKNTEKSIAIEFDGKLLSLPFKDGLLTIGEDKLQCKQVDGKHVFNTDQIAYLANKNWAKLSFSAPNAEHGVLTKIIDGEAFPQTNPLTSSEHKNILSFMSDSRIAEYSTLADKVKNTQKQIFLRTDKSVSLLADETNKPFALYDTNTNIVTRIKIGESIDEPTIKRIVKNGLDASSELSSKLDSTHVINLNDGYDSLGDFQSFQSKITNKTLADTFHDNKITADDFKKIEKGLKYNHANFASAIYPDKSDPKTLELTDKAGNKITIKRNDDEFTVTGSGSPIKIDKKVKVETSSISSVSETDPTLDADEIMDVIHDFKKQAKNDLITLFKNTRVSGAIAEESTTAVKQLSEKFSLAQADLNKKKKEVETLRDEVQRLEASPPPATRTKVLRKKTSPLDKARKKLLDAHKKLNKAEMKFQGITDEFSLHYTMLERITEASLSQALESLQTDPSPENIANVKRDLQSNAEPIKAILDLLNKHGLHSATITFSPSNEDSPTADMLNALDGEIDNDVADPSSPTITRKVNIPKALSEILGIRDGNQLHSKIQNVKDVISENLYEAKEKEGLKETNDRQTFNYIDGWHQHKTSNFHTLPEEDQDQVKQYLGKYVPENIKAEMEKKKKGFWKTVAAGLGAAAKAVGGYISDTGMDQMVLAYMMQCSRNGQMMRDNIMLSGEYGMNSLNPMMNMMNGGYSPFGGGFGYGGGYDPSLFGGLNAINNPFGMGGIGMGMNGIGMNGYNPFWQMSGPDPIMNLMGIPSVPRPQMPIIPPQYPQANFYPTQIPPLPPQLQMQMQGFPFGQQGMQLPPMDPRMMGQPPLPQAYNPPAPPAQHIPPEALAKMVQNMSPDEAKALLETLKTPEQQAEQMQALSIQDPAVAKKLMEDLIKKEREGIKTSSFSPQMTTPTIPVSS